MRPNGLILFAPASALIPGFQRHPEKGVIRGPDVAEQAETYDAGGVLNPRRVCEKVLDLSCGRACTLQGRGIGKLHIDVEVALVFIRQEARRQMFAEEPRGNPGDYKQHHHHAGLVNQIARQADKAIRGALKVCVEPTKEFSERSARLLLRLEK